jgi:uncharacterized membrane protein
MAASPDAANPLGARTRVPLSRRSALSDAQQHVSSSVEEIADMEAASAPQSLSERVSDRITAFSGSMLFILLHAVWFAVWIAANLPGVPWPRFDGFPFGLLTMIVSLEAIFLSTFVLVTQNRQAAAADRRARVDLQVNVIAEREVTRLIQLVAEIHQALGLPDVADRELRGMKIETKVSELVEAIDEADARHLESRDSNGETAVAEGGSGS